MNKIQILLKVPSIISNLDNAGRTLPTSPTPPVQCRLKKGKKEKTSSKPPPPQKTLLKTTTNKQTLFKHKHIHSTAQRKWNLKKDVKCVQGDLAQHRYLPDFNFGPCRRGCTHGCCVGIGIGIGICIRIYLYAKSESGYKKRRHTKVRGAIGHYPTEPNPTPHDIIVEFTVLVVGTSLSSSVHHFDCFRVDKAFFASLLSCFAFWFWGNEGAWSDLIRTLFLYCYSIIVWN